MIDGLYVGLRRVCIVSLFGFHVVWDTKLDTHQFSRARYKYLYIV